MDRRLLDRFLLLLIVLACVFLVEKVIGVAQSAADGLTIASEQGTVQGGSGLVPRFINFDIGAATVRSGASHQGDTGGIPDIPPYVLFPNAGYPLTLVNYTIPPDFATGGDFEARLLLSAYSGNSFPCFYVLNTELVGYGPGHSAALFEPYWAGEPSSSDQYIVPVNDSSIQELPITFQSLDGFPAYPGDAVTFTLWRYADDINDTCVDNIALRSVSFTYQGLTTYLPYTVKSP
ncbi:MAG: hypothetical protein KJ069_03220 [Anaerolineae bacterium]|nr:hypothetical protein [Anaerolineae bacterium]